MEQPKTLTKGIVKAFLDKIIEAKGVAVNEEIRLAMREANYFVQRGMVVGFTNQIFNENNGRYERKFDRVVVYTHSPTAFDCSVRGTSLLAKRIEAPTRGVAQFAKETGLPFTKISVKRTPRRHEL